MPGFGYFLIYDIIILVHPQGKKRFFHKKRMNGGENFSLNWKFKIDAFACYCCKISKMTSEPGLEIVGRSNFKTGLFWV